MNKEQKYKRGFGLMEIIVGVLIISLSLFGLIAVSRLAVQLANNNSQNIKAGFLLEEGVEAVKILRDKGWEENIASLNVSNDYFLEFDASTWKATSSNIYIDDIFERKFVLENVYRDANDDIVVSGTFDPDTKKVVVNVSWFEKSGTTTKNISTYITNLFE